MSDVGLPLGNDFTEIEKQNYFAIQLVAKVVEDFRVKWNTNGSDVYKRLKSCGAVEYLINGYDCLHTQGLDYIVSDVEEMLELQNEEVL